MPRERRRRSKTRESSGPLTRGALPSRTTRRSTVPAFHQPPPKDARNPRTSRDHDKLPSSSSTGKVPRLPNLVHAPPTAHVFHPSATTPIARSSSSSMAQTVSNPLPTPITAGDLLVPPSLPLVAPLHREDVAMDEDRGREMTRSARRSRKDYESYAGPPVLAHHPYNQYYPGVHTALPSRVTLAAASAVATAQVATQRTNRFHRAHRFERLPLTPRSRSPITFTFSGESRPAVSSVV